MDYNKVKCELDYLVDVTVDKLIDAHWQRAITEKLIEIKRAFNDACRELIEQGASRRDIETYFMLKGPAIQRAVKTLAPLGLLHYLTGRGKN